MSVYSSGCAVSLVLLAAWMVCWRGHIHWQNRGAIVVFASGIVVSSWLGPIPESPVET